MVSPPWFEKETMRKGGPSVVVVVIVFVKITVEEGVLWNPLSSTASMVSQICLFTLSWVTPGPFSGEQTHLKRNQASQTLTLCTAMLWSSSAEAETISQAVAHIPSHSEWRQQSLQLSRRLPQWKSKALEPIHTTLRPTLLPRLETVSVFPTIVTPEP